MDATPDPSGTVGLVEADFVRMDVVEVALVLVLLSTDFVGDVLVILSVDLVWTALVLLSTDLVGDVLVIFVLVWIVAVALSVDSVVLFVLDAVLLVNDFFI